MTEEESKNCMVVEHYNLVGYLCAIAVPMLSAIVSILTRQLKDVHASILMFWFGVGTFNAAIIGKVTLHEKFLFQHLLNTIMFQVWLFPVVFPACFP